LKEERAMLLEEWLNVESGFGALGDVSIVQKKLPRKVKRKRAITTEDGAPAGYVLLLLLFFISTNKIRKQS
jgi:crooked neck